ncbi:MAG: sulfoxide reductase heme-binding subunit YedZ [Phycisphaerae bacterium]|nr:sulfoxide reductase heme-binding subunit YedZ [Gemmatimonadaceae bacterium]
MSDAVAQPRDGQPKGQKSGMQQLVRRLVRPALWVLVLLPFATIGYALFFTGLGANPIKELEHLTGRWTMRFLAGSLAVTPIIRLTGWGWLIPQRRFLGLAAFVGASIHLATYIILDSELNLADIAEDIVKRTYITVGFLTFLLLLPLALTSTKASIKRLGGQRWQRLHRLVYVAAITATIHYLWAVKKDTFVPLVYFGIFAVLLGVRLIWRRGGGPRTARSEN